MHLLWHIDHAPLPHRRPSVLDYRAGGVGGSHFAMLIDSALRHWRGFLDTSALFRDEEIRKKMHQLSHRIVWAAHEAADGGSSSKTTRKDFYQKLRAPGEILARRPYAVFRMLIAMREAKRFELDRVIRFPDVNADTIGII